MMANKNMKGCSTSLVIMAMQIKTTMSCHSAPARMANAKRNQIIQRAGEDVGQLEVSRIVCQNGKLGSHFGKQLAVSYDDKNALSTWPWNPRRNESTCSHIRLCVQAKGRFGASWPQTDQCLSADKWLNTLTTFDECLHAQDTECFHLLRKISCPLCGQSSLYPQPWATTHLSSICIVLSLE